MGSWDKSPGGESQAETLVRIQLIAFGFQFYFY